MLELEEAQQKILAAVAQLSSEDVSISDAFNRILRADVAAPVDLPPFDNSAMDGYAVVAADVVNASVQRPVTLHQSGKVAAGETSTANLGSGSCIRIFTGSPLPSGADAVVMQEDTSVDQQDSGKILVTDAVKPWENVRFRGEDVKRGAVVASSGEKVSMGKLSLITAVGVSAVKVGKRPIVGLLATGSELVEANGSLSPGKIYESNRVGLAAMVKTAGGIPKIYPLVPDNLDGTVVALDKAFAECDCVITSGGVSVGEFDFVKAAFDKLGGRMDFWKVAIRPGKPFVFGQRGNKPLFGVPGNPVSALVTCFLLVRPALLKMQGGRAVDPRLSWGLLAEGVSNMGERRHFVRVALDPDGTVHPAGIQASHILSSLAHSNGLLDVAPRTSISAGEKVKVLLWD